jgi:APA family basic amino acid/polyamine antiporter
MIGVLWTFDGWYGMTYLGGEMKEPSKDLPRGMLAGVFIVTLIYVLLNVVYLRAIPVSEMPAHPRIAEAAAIALFGEGAGRLVTAAVMVSAFGCIGSTILYSTRTYLPMARDGVFVPALARLHPRFQTPSLAILLQSAWALALLFTGKYEDLLNTVVFADWVFFGLTVAGLFRLRRRFEGREGFRTPGYPWLPGLFVLVAIAVVLSVIRTAPERSAVGVALLALGVPVYYWSKARAASAPGSDRSR